MDNIAKILRNSVPLLQNASDKLLRQLSMRSKLKTYLYGHKLFTIGTFCRSIMIVSYGTIEIGLSDGGSQYERLDYLGQGSAIGLKGVFTGQQWDYSAWVKSKKAIVVEIDVEVID